MNFALSDEQEFLKEAARGALSRVKTVEAAREALDGGALPDLWPVAAEAGWPGLLISDDHGGAAAVAAALADGSERAAFAPARPPTDLEDAWTVEPELGLTRAPAPTYADGAVTGVVHWVPDAEGADHLVVALADGRA